MIVGAECLLSAAQPSAAAAFAGRSLVCGQLLYAGALTFRKAFHGQASSLRRLMCNELYEQIRQVAQRSAERVVDLLCAGVGRDLGGQARQQPSQRLRTMTLQREEVLELAYDPFYDLALARGPAPIGLRPRPAGVVFRGGRNERSVKLHPQPLPLEPREALVGQVRSVAVGSYEGVAYGPLV